MKKESMAAFKKLMLMFQNSEFQGNGGPCFILSLCFIPCCYIFFHNLPFFIP